MTDLFPTLIINLFILIFTISSFSQDLDSSDFTKIVGGQPAKQGQFPYIVSLQNKTQKGINRCGGGIISQRWILTAAHCLHKVPTNDLVAYVGSVYLDKGGKYYDIEEIKRHEKFNITRVINDIALIKTAKTIIFTRYVQRIHLTGDVSPGEILTAVGWGDTKHVSAEKNVEPNQLQYVRSSIVPYEVCAAALPNIIIDNNSQICFGGRVGFGVCKGDSGTPLIRSTRLRAYAVGIVSWGIPCGIGKPDVFTRVWHYYRWIRRITQSLGQENVTSKYDEFL